MLFSIRAVNGPGQLAQWFIITGQPVRTCYELSVIQSVSRGHLAYRRSVSIMTASTFAVPRDPYMWLT